MSNQNENQEENQENQEENQENQEERKKMIRMNIIYKALEDGWSVKKTENNSKTFEFTKNKSLENDYKGLVIFSKSANNKNICDDIQKHLDNLKTSEKSEKKPTRSVSTPIIKNKEA